MVVLAVCGDKGPLRKVEGLGCTSPNMGTRIYVRKSMAFVKGRYMGGCEMVMYQKTVVFKEFLASMAFVKGRYIRGCEIVMC